MAYEVLEVAGAKAEAEKAQEQMRVREDLLLGWLRMLVFPGQITELRALKMRFPSGSGAATCSGYYDYDHLINMVRHAIGLSDRSHGSLGHPSGVYFTINPLTPDLLSVRNCRCDIVGKGETTSDKHVTGRNWMLVDIDPERIADVSSTDTEKLLAKETAVRVMSHLGDDLGWPSPIVVDSGNGYHLYYRVSLPADDGGLISNVLYYLADRFDIPDKVKIDPTVANAARISKIPGTMSRKGDSTIDRPHRVAVLKHCPDGGAVMVPTESLNALAEIWTKKKSEQKDVRSKGLTLDSRERPKSQKAKKSIVDRARAYLAAIPLAVSENAGGRRTYEVACHLVRGFALSIHDAFPLIAEWNQSCVPPWTDSELMHKLESALSCSNEPMGGLINETSSRTSGGTVDVDDIYEVDDPRRLATMFLDRHSSAAGQRRFRRWNGEWYIWDFVSYSQLQNDDVDSRLLNFIQQEFEADGIERREAYEHVPEEKRDEKSKPPNARKVTTTLMSNVTRHMASMSFIPQSAKLPCWIQNEPPGFDSRETIMAKNGIINLRKLLAGDPGYLIPPTPDYFSTSCLPFDFEETAKDPVEWLRFLGDLWPDDPESIACLQEWMGLFLVPDNRFQKMLMIIGPRRSGKGTISKVIQGLVGAANVSCPTLAGFASNFGLWPLIGKYVAIIGDARLSGKTDSAILTERLLQISGDDPVNIDRKNLSSITVALPARIVMMSNEVPRFVDSSNALAGRFIMLKMTNSFFGQEDQGLCDRLLSELPSILVWAIEGWQRLTENGRFTIPQSSHDIATQLEDAASPVGAFVREKCEVGNDYKVDRTSLFDAWVEWCTEEGRAHPGTKTSFGIQLRAVATEIKDVEIHTFGIRRRAYGGIRLKMYEATPDDVKPNGKFDFD